MTVKYHVVYIIMALSMSPVDYAKAETKPGACHSHCVSPYGQVLGETSSKVIAYSNCNNQCVDYTSNKINHVYTGIKWQCVEFARRWLLVNHGVVFDSINTAADMWAQINEYKEVGFGDKVQLETYKNGSEKMPIRGSLLIYEKALFSTGHVAVVVSIDKIKKNIYIAEQNFKNLKWPSNYSRAISYSKKGDTYWVHDEFLIGWKSIKTN